MTNQVLNTFIHNEQNCVIAIELGNSFLNSDSAANKLHQVSLRCFYLASSMLFVGIYQCTHNLIGVQQVICEESFWQLLNSFSVTYINLT